MKRCFDVGVSAFLIAVLSPLMLAIAIGVRFLHGTPILFRHTRPGLHGKPFTLYKFRTMLDLRDGEGNLLTDAERLTRFGSFLRSSSLDELPELWNVLIGDMSMVGPRPLLMQYLDRYTPDQARRHNVKPGVTGLSQIGGRNAISWDEKFTLDLYYVDHHSLWLDVKILLKTPWKVLSSEGISHEGYTTMPEYFGGEEANEG